MSEDRREALAEAHWLLFVDDGHVTGCHCGFRAEPDDEGFGDSVVRHLINVGAERVRAAVENMLRSHDTWANQQQQVLPGVHIDRKIQPTAIRAALDGASDA